MSAENIVTIWKADLLESFDQQAAMAVLSEAERIRHQRFVTPELQMRFLRAHSVKRQVLARYLQTAPEYIVFAEGEHGKPYIPGAKWHFNLTHSGNLCLLAVSQKNVGIDVEQTDRRVDVEEISQRFFCQSEADFILAASDCREAFFQVWVRKEAVVKALGEGLTCSLKSFAVHRKRQASGFLIDWLSEDQHKSTCWATHEWQVAEGYFAAVVVASKNAVFEFEAI